MRKTDLDGPPPARALVLFDIDGTLLRRSGPHHRQVLEEAIWDVAKIRSSTEGIPVQGMLDRDILRLMMEREGLDDNTISGTMPAVVDKAQRLYQVRCPDLRGRVCPGVRGTLRRLVQAGLVLGLVTGNLSRIGWRKMEKAGLREYFRFGSFAEAGATRAELARLAIEEAQRKRWIGQNAAISLVGDHPNDIQAARANSIRSIAVATGVVSSPELAEHAPDVLLPDMRQLRLEMVTCQ